jgi:hypothetical protein
MWVELKQVRDAAKVGTPSSAGRSPQLTAVPWRPRVRWTVARIGERELSRAGSASEQAQFFQKPNRFTNTVLSVVRCFLRDFPLRDLTRINFASFGEFAFEFPDYLLLFPFHFYRACDAASSMRAATSFGLET